MLQMLTDERLSSFARIVTVDNATNKRERIMGKWTFSLRSTPSFLQEDGYSSLKNVLKMYQKVEDYEYLYKVCACPVPKAHMWKYYLLLTNWRVRREAVCVMLQISVWLKEWIVLRTNALY